MLFSSVPFLFYFLPAVLLFYFVLPKTFRNAVLLCASLFFYYWGEPKYLVLMVASILAGYVFGILIDRCRHKRLMLTLGTALCLVALLYFKYADFFIGNLNRLTGASLPLLKIALPIGISFYTFQILSYLIDVYRGDASAQYNPIKLATYVALFPQLIAGPIVRYTTVAAELSQRKTTVRDFSEGAFRFIIGLSKKVLIANTLFELCEVFRDSSAPSVLFYWMYAVAFTLQIYFDFSGYSDMAIGLGRIFGFHFTENFEYPYISASVTEFWRRWHISLGQWFRDYVYIPLGGNRRGRARWFLNILIVWLLTGFWHCADWNFVIWGLYFAVWLVLEKLVLLRLYEKLPRFVCRVFVLFLVVVSFVIFNADGMTGACGDLSGMFGMKGLPLWTPETLYYLRSFAVVFALAVLGATPLVKKCAHRLYGGGAASGVLRAACALVLLVFVSAYLVDGSFNPFLYFRF